MKKNKLYLGSSSWPTLHVFYFWPTNIRPKLKTGEVTTLGHYSHVHTIGLFHLAREKGHKNEKRNKGKEVLLQALDQVLNFVGLSRAEEQCRCKGPRCKKFWEQKSKPREYSLRTISFYVSLIFFPTFSPIHQRIISVLYLNHNFFPCV